MNMQVIMFFFSFFFSKVIEKVTIQSKVELKTQWDVQVIKQQVRSQFISLYIPDTIYRTSLRLLLANSVTNLFMSRFLVISFSWAKMTKSLFRECSIVLRRGVIMRVSVEKELSHAAETHQWLVQWHTVCARWEMHLCTAECICKLQRGSHQLAVYPLTLVLQPQFHFAGSCYFALCVQAPEVASGGGGQGKLLS